MSLASGQLADRPHQPTPAVWPVEELLSWIIEDVRSATYVFDHLNTVPVRCARNASATRPLDRTWCCQKITLPEAMTLQSRLTPGALTHRSFSVGFPTECGQKPHVRNVCQQRTSWALLRSVRLAPIPAANGGHLRGRKRTLQKSSSCHKPTSGGRAEPKDEGR